MRILTSYLVVVLVLILPCEIADAQNARFEFCVSVVDEDGMPLEGVGVSLGCMADRGSKNDGFVEEISDIAGRCTFKGYASDLVILKATAPGYYESRQKPSTYLEKSSVRSSAMSESKKSFWEPLGCELQMVLKRKGTQVPMFAGVVRRELPLSQKSGRIGFDMMQCDFIYPFGNGRVAHIYFRGADSDLFDGTGLELEISFPNEGDGLVELESKIGNDNPKDRGSELRSPTKAPRQGYKPFSRVEYMGRSVLFPKRDSIYVFRTLTVLGENGSIKSALYGKVYLIPRVQRVVNGDGVRDFIEFSYHLNPDGSTNLEFDGSSNLIKNIPVGFFIRSP